MARTVVKVEGLRELNRALAELPKSTGKAVLRRTLKNAAQPVADDAERMAPRDEGTLAASIGVSTKLTRRQRTQHRKMFKNDRASVEMFMGPGGLTQAWAQEFGTETNPPQPYLRPAWDAGKMGVLNAIKENLGSEIDKAAKRLARKAARLSAKG